MPSRRAKPPVVVNPEAVLVEATKNLAENVRQRRRAAKVSQERLAETARVSAIYLGQVERGKALNPSLGVIAALAAALDCRAADLLAPIVPPTMTNETNAATPDEPPETKPRSPRQ